MDITNYVLHAIGQPLHVFNADAIRGSKIIVKTLPEGTPFITLDEKERKLTASDLMICDAEGPLCIAGVYGGLLSGVQADTQHIFIESACFSPKSISKTERIHALKTDASSRFSKGTDPEITVQALQLAASLVIELAGGEVASEIIDVYPQKINAVEIELRFHRLETITALQINKEKVVEILQALHIEIMEQSDRALKVKVPAYKNDVIREIDLIEEILRMYGYDKVPVPKTIKAPFTLRPKPDTELLRFDIGKKLSTRGFYELFTNPISRSKYIEKFAPALKPEMITLKNSLNSELDCLRQALLFSGLEVIQYNANRKQSDLKLYEFGKTFHAQGDTYLEKNMLVLYMCGNTREENWRAKQTPVDFFDIKKHVQSLCGDMGVVLDERQIHNHPFLSECIGMFLQDTEVGYYGL
ncbi:MAG: phenylalanine--tRNA ligase subunit beta, partial [Chitinophagales bacterium]